MSVFFRGLIQSHRILHKRVSTKNVVTLRANLALKKQNFAEGEIAILDEACVYKRGEYWQFRLWLLKENKYARKSLRTPSKSTAVERGKVYCLEIYGKLQQRLCKDFGFTAGMLKGSTNEERSKK